MKRLICFVLLLILGLSLVSCGNSTETEQEKEQEAVSPQDTPETDADAGVAAPPIFQKQPEAPRFVFEESGYDAPTFSVTLSLPDGSRAEGIVTQWTVNGEPVGEAKFHAGAEITDTYDAAELKNKPAGVYRVVCTAGCKVNETWYRSSSYTVNFIVCRGILENSILTFSDVHQDWDHVGIAIQNTMLANDGKIPALVISTGDWNNTYQTGNVVENRNACIDEVIGRITLQLGGIDTVWVSGNHDNGYAAGFTNQNREVDLGIVPSDYEDVANGISGTGILFDSRSAGWERNAGTGRKASGLIVIGVNFEDVLAARSGEANGKYDKPSCDYGDGTEDGASVYKHLNTALERIAADYHGELVVISTHAGLHVLGVDPSSNAPSSFKDPDYCITGSAAIVELVNSYAEQYGMNIVWLFGHDHSKSEQEFLKLPGNTVVSTVNFEEQTSKEIVLQFIYGHAGYITDNEKMSGHSRYSVLTWNADSVTRTVSVIVPEQDSLRDQLDFNVSFLTKNSAVFE